MKSLLKLKINDYLLIVLFSLAIIPFTGEIIASETLIPMKTAVILMLWSRSGSIPNNEKIIIGFIILFLTATYFLHDCGLGAILNFINMYVLLCIYPYVNLNKNVFFILGLLCLGLCFYQIKFVQDNYMYFFDKNSKNANSIGLFVYFMSALGLLFLSSRQWIFRIVSFSAAVIVYPILELTHCRSAMVAYTILLAFYIACLIPKVKRYFFVHLSLLKNTGLLLLLGNILLVFVAAYTNLDVFLSTLLKTSDTGESIFSERDIIWKESIGNFLDDPFFGIGNHFQIKSYSGIAIMHNSILAILVYYGFFVFFFALRKLKQCYIHIYNINCNKISYLTIPVVIIGAFIIAIYESVFLEELMFFSLLPFFYSTNFDINDEYN